MSQSLRTCLLLAAVSAWGLRVGGADLADQRTAYDKSLDKIDAEHQQHREQLQDWYAKSLLALKKRFQQEGNLDGVTTVLAEISRFEAELDVSAGLTALPELRKLRDSFQDNATRSDINRAKQVTDVVSRYDRWLARTEKDLVRAGRIEQATAVRAERERIQDSPTVISARQCLALHEPKPEPSPTPAPSPAAPRLTRDTFGELIIPVHADKNLRADGKVVTEGIYWLETDQTQGRVQLEFKDMRLSSLRPKRSVRLRVRVDDAERAETDDRIHVYAGSHRLGTLRGAEANQWVDIPLDPAKLPNEMALTLILVAEGKDGLAIRSKSTGMGPELRIRY